MAGDVGGHRPRIPWSVGAQHALIVRASHHRILWDHTHPFYSKKIPKRMAWKVVAAGLRHDFPELDALDLSEDDAQSKFSVLKSYYQREVRKIQSGEAQGSRWEFFRSFSSFMQGIEEQPSLPTTSSSSSSSTLPQDFQAPSFEMDMKTTMKVTEEEYQVSGGEEAPLTPSSSSAAEDQPSQSPPQKKRKHKTKSPCDQMIEKTLTRINNILTQNERSGEDVADKTGDLVRNFLFILSGDKKKELSMKIIRLLQEEALTDQDVA